jgi:hypothetical protein
LAAQESAGITVQSQHRGKRAHDGVTSPAWPTCAFSSTGIGSNPAQYLPTHACL